MTSGEWWATVGGEVHLLQSPNGVRARCGLLVEYAERVRRIVDDFPPLTAEQKDRIVALLRPVSRSDRQPAALAGELCQLCRLSYVADRAEIWFCEQRRPAGHQLKGSTETMRNYRERPTIPEQQQRYSSVHPVGSRRTVRYRVRRRDVASRIYRRLGRAKRKPHVLATARLIRLCELAAMDAMPGVSLGKTVVVDHKAPAVRGSTVTVDAVCTHAEGRDWEWHVEVRDEHEVIALVDLGFVADIDGKRYARRLAPKLAARPARIVWWLRILDALALLVVVASPAEAVYAGRGWISMLALETVLIVGWLLALTGLPFAIGDWFTVRPGVIKKKEAEFCIEKTGSLVGRWADER